MRATAARSAADNHSPAAGRRSDHGSGRLERWQPRRGFHLRLELKRKAVETAKFYFFDTGVVRALRRLPRVSDASADFGEKLAERSIIVCREERPRIEHGIEVWPLEFFLAALWEGRL